jgi:hypothetical protein
MLALRYVTRDLLWAMAVVGIAFAWIADHQRQAAREGRVREWLQYVMGASDAEIEPVFQPPTAEQRARRRAQKDLISREALPTERR